ncbi:hypothetical protein ANANG_G00200650 [Anguilla anguilla]|uniref:UEV domain-containing protein n=1 Tax=Anguilla anguilla TaxID=7936 RepID=A0A9D3M1G8_ANGAN|nr:hypothetical protein ANANG_G00200650 [Anguilla anguilla]
MYKDLKPVMDTYVFNDGSFRDLMSLRGTVPVNYRGNVYNIPVCLWLMDTYPYNPPICFVKPTSAMMIKSGKHIDANGKMYLPYLHEWKHPQSDLYGLIQVMIVVFGEEPPVFSRPTTPRILLTPEHPSQESVLQRQKLQLEIEVLQRQKQVLEIQEQYYSIKLRRLLGDDA